MTGRAAAVLGVCGSFIFAGCGDDTGTGGAGGEAASGTVKVQISGEELATEGFGFPTGSEVTIADGWAISFDHVFVTVGRAWLSDNPDLNPNDASQTGVEVAEAVGPWAVDLARPGDVPGAGGEGTAHSLALIDSESLNGGGPLAADRRYAFSFSFVPASASASPVGFGDDPDALAAYDEAVAGGYAVYYVGTATFVGGSCEVSDETYDFTAIPTTVRFRLGFDTPVHYTNCQNQENDGEPFADEEYQRGLSIRSDRPSLAQITVHVEHPFYSDVQHEPGLFVDQLAALLVGAPEGTELTMEHLQGLDPTGFEDGAGENLPWRVCDGSTLPAGTGRAFEVGTIPTGPGQDPAEGFRDYRDYVRYVQSTQGHMNGGEGLCYIARQYDSPR
ncbi:MAG: hypothetical protein IPM79_33165 [Polyangiaceae bacterium]|jgi:hypothetical protein|nr:hypothetical protein [Polyangiaceae bacterium]